MSSNPPTNYPYYGYRPIQMPSQSLGSTIQERERQRAQTRRQLQKNMRSYKVLLIGESGVGKSTLVARLCEGRFFAESKPHTLGIDMFEKEVEIDGEAIKMYIWDTVGQERFDSITTQYYRGGAGIIVVYDITSTQSFQQLVKWIGYVQSHATADVSLMLLGSKSDLEGRREVTSDDAEKFAANHDITLFYEVSAKSGSNVNEAFEAFFKQIHLRATGPVESNEPAPSKTGNSSGCCFK